MEQSRCTAPPRPPLLLILNYKVLEKTEPSRLLFDPKADRGASGRRSYCLAGHVFKHRLGGTSSAQVYLRGRWQLGCSRRIAARAGIASGWRMRSTGFGGIWSTLRVRAPRVTCGKKMQATDYTSGAQ